MTSVLHDQCETISSAVALGDPIVVATVSYPQAGTAVCRITGTVDLITAPQLADRLIATVHEGRPHLVIDLSPVAVLRLTGLHAALDALDSRGVDGHLAIVIDPRSDAITRSEIGMLGEIVDIHHDLVGALRACLRASVSHGGRHRATEPFRYQAL